MPATETPHQVIQLYEMIVVRHGLMLVGPAGGGKSSNLHVLEETLTRLKQLGVEVSSASVIDHAPRGSLLEVRQRAGCKSTSSTGESVRRRRKLLARWDVNVSG